MNCKFIFPEVAAGYLSPDNLQFFYYTMGKGELENEYYTYEWNDKIVKFLNERGLTIEEKESGNIPTEFVENAIYFTIDKKTEGIMETKPMAFIRHLRNAFAHYHIGEQQKVFYLKDYPNDKDNDKLTMMGKIKQDDLKELCFLLLKQGEIANDSMNVINSEEL